MMVMMYLLIGVLANVVWARGFWKRESTQEWIKRSGYAVVAHEAKSMRTLMLGMWPVFLPWMILIRISSALNVASDPHIEHRRQFKESMNNYTKLYRLEIAVNGRSDANKPEAWCACLEGLDEV